MHTKMLCLAVAAASLASSHLLAAQAVTNLESLAGMAGYYQVMPSGAIRLFPQQGMGGMSGMGGMQGR
jgi:hypothetical protein